MFKNSVQWLLAGGGPLKERVLRGGFWLLVGDGVARGAGLVKLAILARLLSPEDFGLMGIALVVLGGVEYFTQMGMNNALIQKSEDIRPYLDTAWTIQVLRSVGLTVTLIVGAPLAAWFFGSPEAISVIQAIGLVTLFRSLANPAVVYLRKELDFRHEVLWRLSGVGAGLFAAVPLALVYRNVWALVLSVIAAQAAETLASYWIKPYSPRPRLEWGRVRELMVFGKWIFWLQIVDFLGLYTDRFIVGKVLGTTSLGLYQMARQVAVVPTSNIGAHVHGLMFPAFSKLRDERDVRRAFLRALGLLSSVVIPASCFLTVFAKPLVQILLAPRWLSIAPAVQILAWTGAATAMTGLAHALFQAVGKPDLSVRASLLRLLVLVGALYPLTRALGITGMALAVTTSTAAGMAYQFLIVTRLLRSTSLEMAATLKIGALGSLPFLGAWVLVSPAPSPSLFVTAALAVAMYVTILAPAVLSYFRTQVV